MRLFEAASRAALGWVFIQAGAGVVRNPENPSTQRAGPVLAAIRSTAPVSLPDDNTLIRVNAATQVTAGAAMALGIAPRVAATVLIGSLIPTTLGGHRFWEFDDPAQRAPQRAHFIKNISIAGGLLHVAITRRK